LSSRAEIAKELNLCVKCFKRPRTIGANCAECKESAKKYRESRRGKLIAETYNVFYNKYSRDFFKQNRKRYLKRQEAKVEQRRILL
jgi:hypothetical protein